jgi:hypothetical protein
VVKSVWEGAQRVIESQGNASFRGDETAEEPDGAQLEETARQLWVTLMDLPFPCTQRHDATGRVRPSVCCERPAVRDATELDHSICSTFVTDDKMTKRAYSETENRRLHA